MSEILSIAFILLLVAAFAGLIAWVRRDTFTGAKFQAPEPPQKPAKRAAEPHAAPSIRAGVLRLN